MLYNNSKIYNLIKNLLEKIEIKKIETEEAEIKNHIIIIGFHRIGYILAHKILEKTKNIIVVDFDPAIEKALKKENIPHILGDIMDDEVLAKLNIEKAKLIISTIPHNEENLFILEKLKDKNIPIIVTATNVFDAMNYYKLGAFYVIIPHFLGGEKAGELILSILDNLENNKVTEEHKKYLQSKIELEHL